MTSAGVVFLHIPKTAGTSLHLLLLEHYAADAICPIRDNKLDQMSMEDLRKYRLFSGHYYFDQVERIPEPRILLTILREPMARLRSLYDYHRSFRWDAIPEPEAAGGRMVFMAKKLPLLEYLRCADPLARTVVNNPMLRQLIGEKYNSPEGNLRLSDDAALNLALANLERFDAVGFADSANASLRRFEEVLELQFPESMPCINTFESLESDTRFEKVERSALTDATTAELLRNTELDRKIYDHAVSRFKPRLHRQNRIGGPVPSPL